MPQTHSIAHGTFSSFDIRGLWIDFDILYKFATQNCGPYFLKIESIENALAKSQAYNAKLALNAPYNEMVGVNIQAVVMN